MKTLNTIQKLSQSAAQRGSWMLPQQAGRGPGITQTLLAGITELKHLL